MSRKPVSSKAMLGLIAGGLVLPVVICVILALAALLAAMGDSAGAVVLRYVAMGAGIAWSIVLVCLVLVQGLNALVDRDDPDK